MCSPQTDDKFDGVNLQTKQNRKQKFAGDTMKKKGHEFLMRW